MIHFSKNEVILKVLIIDSVRAIPRDARAFPMAEGITLGLWVLSKLSIELNYE